MKKKPLSILLDRSLLIFLIIGAANTVLCWGLMLLLYDWLHMGYWGASFAAFVIASISSYYFNRRFSFKSREGVGITIVKFALVILVCYVLAYSIAKPLTYDAVDMLHNGWMERHRDQIAMIVGNVVFTGFNYFGQRFFAFRKKKEE